LIKDIKLLSVQWRATKFKRRFRLDVRKSVFSNRVINSWNALPTQCVNCNTVDTFKKYVSIALESETDVNS